MDILALDDDTYEKIYKLLEFVDNYDKAIEKISLGFIKPKPEEREEFILKYINDNGLTDKIIIVLKNELIEK
jgi:hypothetical protein